MSRFSYFRTYYIQIIPKNGKTITKEFKEYDDAKKYLDSLGKPSGMDFYGRTETPRYFYDDKTVYFGFTEDCQVHPLEV